MLICFSFLKTDFNSASLFQLKQVEKIKLPTEYMLYGIHTHSRKRDINLEKATTPIWMLKRRIDR